MEYLDKKLIFAPVCYMRLNKDKRCAGCLETIKDYRVVIGAFNFHFHTECFKCSTCQCDLTKGAICGMVKDKLLCSTHQDTYQKVEETKPKRNRTTLKAKQLFMMKSHFGLNPTPTPTELEAISQKTGLRKRTIQVQFSTYFFWPAHVENLSNVSNFSTGFKIIVQSAVRKRRFAKTKPDESWYHYPESSLNIRL